MSRKVTIIAIVLSVLIGTSMHFVHHVPFFNHFLGYIFPVKESVMAHMKMVFYPMLLLSLCLCIGHRDIKEFGAPILAGLAMMPLIVLVFFSYWVFVRHELMAVDAVIYVAAMFGAVFLARTGSYLRTWVNHRGPRAEIRRLPIELFGEMTKNG